MTSIARSTQLDAATRAAVREIAAELAAEYGAPPLNDHSLLQLDGEHPGVTHLVASDRGTVIGYAQVELTAGRANAEIAATGPLVDELLAVADADTIWAHGRETPVAEAAERFGYVAVRTLWQLRRPMPELAPVALPDGVSIRPFVVGQDEDAWLAVNSAAFRDHAEQGHWTREDVETREREAWFDPAGLLLAERAGSVIGFHWTKIHEDGRGEVYVLAVSPEAQGMHLGFALLITGIAYLHSRGVTEILLYVDDSNSTAMRLYEGFGFIRYDRDVQYSRDN